MNISYHVNGVLYIDKNIGVGYRLKLWLLDIGKVRYQYISKKIEI